MNDILGAEDYCTNSSNAVELVELLLTTLLHSPKDYSNNIAGLIDRHGDTIGMNRIFEILPPHWPMKLLSNYLISKLYHFETKLNSLSIEVSLHKSLYQKVF